MRVVASRVGIALALVACATPYQRMGVRGGYTDQQMGNGDILITVKVNGNTDASVALAYMLRRAGELCPSGYETKDGSQVDDSSWTRTTGTIHRAELNRVIRCKSDAPAPRDPNERQVVVGPGPLWCDYASGECFAKQEACTTQTCARRDAGACFNALHIVDDVMSLVCATDIGGCEAKRATYEANPDFKQDRVCSIYRAPTAADGGQ